MGIELLIGNQDKVNSGLLVKANNNFGEIITGGTFVNDTLFLTKFNGLNIEIPLTISGGGSLSNDPYLFSTWSGDTVSGATRQALANKLESLAVFVDNGLTKNENTISLGGQLTKETVIDGNNQNFKLLKTNKISFYSEGFYIGNGFNDRPSEIKIQSDGKILVGGYFNSYDEQEYNYFIRLNEDGSVDNTFNFDETGFNDYVLDLVLQSDGKIVCVGLFNQYNNQTYNGIIRLNSDGSVDNTFNIGNGFNSTVYNVEIQSDGKLIVSGEFTEYDGNSSNRIIRLNPDGSIDDAFNVGLGFDNGVNRLKIRPDGKIIATGYFTEYNTSPITTIVVLNSDGTLDTSFDAGTGFDDGYLNIAIQSDNKIIVGGYFTSYNNQNYSGYLMRLNIDGTRDFTFDYDDGFDDGVEVIEIQSDGKIIVGGSFTSYDEENFNKIIRLNNNASIDYSFNIGEGFNDTVYVISTQQDNKVLVSGYFNIYKNQVVNGYLCRLTDEGTLDTPSYEVYLNNDTLLHYGKNYHDRYDDRTLVDKEYVDSFSVNPENGLIYSSDRNIGLGGDLIRETVINTNLNEFKIANSNKLSFYKSGGFFIGTGFNNAVISITKQNDDKILVGGFFTSYNGNFRNRIIRLNEDGSIDDTFNIGSGFNGAVRSIAVEADGKIIVVGQFTQYNNNTRNYITRLNEDGSINTNTELGEGFNNGVNVVKIQLDGKILVGGSFTTYDGNPYNRIIRLNTDGSIDNTFNIGSGFSDSVLDIEIQSDGKILIGGFFTSYNDNFRNRIIRLNEDGSIDNTFNIGTGFSTIITKIKVQNNNKILIGGYFNSYDSEEFNYIVRLNEDGTVDNTFNIGSGFNNAILSMSLQSDNKILIGGFFTSYNDNFRNRIIRLNEDGSIDDTFNIGTGFNNSVESFIIQTNNKIIVGGQFTSYSGQSYNRILRLNPDGSIDNKDYELFLDKDNLLYYGENYHTRYDNRTLVDKEYVDNQINNIPQSSSLLNSSYSFALWSGDTVSGATRQALANEFENVRLIPINGLTKVSNNVKLGGSLIENTQIDGNFDLTFKNNKSFNIENTIPPFNSGGTGFNDVVRRLIFQGSNILVGGQFTTYNGIDCSDRLVRLNPNGSLDTSFNIGGTGFNLTVSTIFNQSDNRILVGGSFTTYNGINCPDFLVRLNSDGSLDNTFNSGGTGFNSLVNSVIGLNDGKILVGGNFTTYNGVACPGRLVRLNVDGSIDVTFNTGGTGFNTSLVAVLLRQSDDKILVGGNFTTYNGINCPDDLTRINSDGSLDTAFNSGGTGFNGTVLSLCLQSDSKILVGGTFTTYNAIDCPDNLIRLNSNGSIDNTFNSGGTGFNGNILDIYELNNKKILVAGSFTTYNGIDCPDGLIRLNPDGSIDNTFNSGGTGFSSTVQCILVENDDDILVGGNFTSYNGIDCSDRLIKLTNNGSINSDVDIKIFVDKNNGLLKYQNNYQKYYTNRTLVDKEYVDINFTTTNTPQSITGQKTFSGNTLFNNILINDNNVYKTALSVPTGNTLGFGVVGSGFTSFQFGDITTRNGIVLNTATSGGNVTNQAVGINLNIGYDILSKGGGSLNLFRNSLTTDGISINSSNGGTIEFRTINVVRGRFSGSGGLGTQSLSALDNNLALIINSQGTATGSIVRIMQSSSGGGINPTSGSFRDLVLGVIQFNPISGGANYSFLNIGELTSINQTGSASGTTTGIDFNPTITNNSGNLYAYRSRVSAASNRWNLFIDGTAKNFLAGNLELGSNLLINDNLLQKTALSVPTNSTLGIGVVGSEFTTFQFGDITNRNGIQLLGAASGSSVVNQAVGVDTNISYILRSKGTGLFRFEQGTGATSFGAFTVGGGGAGGSINFTNVISVAGSIAITNPATNISNEARILQISKNFSPSSGISSAYQYITGAIGNNPSAGNAYGIQFDPTLGATINTLNRVAFLYTNRGSASNTNVYGLFFESNIRNFLAGNLELGSRLIQSNSIAPSASTLDSFIMYANDIVVGNSAPHFRTEAGNVIKLYSETTSVSGATRVHNMGSAIHVDDTFDGYTLAQVVKALRNQGLLS